MNNHQSIPHTDLTVSTFLVWRRDGKGVALLRPTLPWDESHLRKADTPAGCLTYIANWGHDVDFGDSQSYFYWRYPLRLYDYAERGFYKISERLGVNDPIGLPIYEWFDNAFVRSLFPGLFTAEGARLAWQRIEAWNVAYELHQAALEKLPNQPLHQHQVISGQIDTLSEKRPSDWVTMARVYASEVKLGWLELQPVRLFDPARGY